MKGAWGLHLVPSAHRELENLDAMTAKQIIRKFDWLAVNFSVISHERLSSILSDYYKLRVGDYRVIYQFDLKRQIITVLKIGRRDKIYR